MIRVWKFFKFKKVYICSVWMLWIRHSLHVFGFSEDLTWSYLKAWTEKSSNTLGDLMFLIVKSVFYLSAIYLKQKNRQNKLRKWTQLGDWTERKVTHKYLINVNRHIKPRSYKAIFSLHFQDVLTRYVHRIQGKSWVKTVKDDLLYFSHYFYSHSFSLQWVPRRDIFLQFLT